jgi:hypothetical protein
MKKRLSGYLLGSIGILVGGWFIANPYEALPVPMGESVYPVPTEQWAPTRAEIADYLQTSRFSGEMEKLEVFTGLFKKRYRDRSLPVHCRVVMLQDGQLQLRLFCAAVVPRWYTARIARSLWEEARHHLDHPVPVNIYESAIFRDPRYIGKCHLLENGTGMEVRFTEWSNDRIPRSESPESGRADPSVNRSEGIFRPPVKFGSRSRF